MSTDALSEVLSAVHLTGSVFFDVTAKSPWVAEAPPAAQIAHQVTPGAQHVMEYHVVTRGSCWISLVGGAEFEPVRLAEGDIAVIPHGDPHVVSSAPGMRAKPDLDLHRRPEDDNALPFTLRPGGDGPFRSLGRNGRWRYEGQSQSENGGLSGLKAARRPPGASR